MNPALCLCRVRSWLLSAVLLVVCGVVGPARAALQFDVFLGYDGVVPEASWFPVVCEVKNDGPAFMATVEVDGGTYNQSQTRQMVVELPTGTLKRFTIPVFSAARGFTSWDVRLLDERGKVRAEQPNLRPTKQIAIGTPLIGSLSRGAGWTPPIKPILPQHAEMQPAAARLQPSIFPDNPLVLERLDCIYLNSERASDLHDEAQLKALYAWLYAGGHLIVGVEQPSDINSTPWLKKLFPCDLKDLKTIKQHTELQDWLRRDSWPTNVSQSSDYRRQFGRARTGSGEEISGSNPFANLNSDLDFEAAPLQVAVGAVSDGAAEVTAGDTPLMVTAQRGRGRVTALMFSPEREPVRSWKNLPTFWAKLAEVPGDWYVSSDYSQQGGWSSDGIFGAMIDSTQVHKLPVGWLLLLLLVYLVVIGPLDQFWLKRIGKPMLTWITFPCYVVLFSLVIYFIGYKLRAGESEWNDLHVVDVLLNGDRAELRGRTYSSVYAPSNQRYLLESRQKCAALRGEFAGLYGGGQSSEKATIVQNGDNFKAEIFVPVWTSQLFVSDWWHAASVPLDFTVRPEGDGWQAELSNRTDRKLTNLQLVVEERIISLGEVGPGESKTVKVTRGQGMAWRQYVNSQGSLFQQAVSERQHAFGSSESGRIPNLPDGAMAASFLSQLHQQQNYGNNFISPPGSDVSAVVEHGSALLLAWAGDYAPIKPMYQFSPRRSHRNTLWRMAVEVK
ncbi:MAG TPA: hypothetical protein VN578_01945 [Candidatus Binatia bacterium]|jgi:hypothetical protein|nr:hypothetical protein [Candidatus Binatia bacterium]